MDKQELIQKALEQDKITYRNLYDVLNIDEGDMQEIRQIVRDEVADQMPFTFLRDIVDDALIDKIHFDDFTMFYYAMKDSDLDLQIEDIESQIGIEIEYTGEEIDG
tara:strand:+ start:3821 stop:4138 length:318 start_codon:yes stop_codon:yes gene_type:complete